MRKTAGCLQQFERRIPMTVLHMSRRLIVPPACRVADGYDVRTFAPRDVAGWLALRFRAFSDELRAVRPWSEADFAREMTAKSWWRDDHTWIATPSDRPEELIGAVTLAMRKDAAIVHWLMVDPDWRRRGVGRQLVTRLERTVWDNGGREVRLESHRHWRRAMLLYAKLGYTNSPTILGTDGC
jgi:GNAT superfamily N-acetyltransferase